MSNAAHPVDRPGHAAGAQPWQRLGAAQNRQAHHLGAWRAGIIHKAKQVVIWQGAQQVGKRLAVPTGAVNEDGGGGHHIT